MNRKKKLALDWWAGGINRTFNKTVDGLVYRDDFTSSSGWSSNAKISQVNELAFLQFGYIPGFDFTGGGVGSVDEYGARQGQVFIDDDGTWYMFYDGGEFPTTIGIVDSGDPWNSRYATSADRGRTWTKQGVFGPGNNDGFGGQLTYGSAMGWVNKYGGTYYFYRAILSGSGGGPPYNGDFWSASTITGPYTYIGAISKTPGTFTEVEVLPGSVQEEAGVFYLFIQGKGSTGSYTLGKMSGPTPAGPWTLDTTPIADSSFFSVDGTNNPENERVFKHPATGKFVMLFNSFKSSRSDFSWTFISDSITDWSAKRLTRIIEQGTMDGTPAIGVVTHFSTAENNPVVGSNGFIPISYDGEGAVSSASNPSDYAWKRKIRNALLEPSSGLFRYNGTDAAAYNIYKALAHTNFIAEFAIQFSTNTTNRNSGIWLRADGAGTNGYRIVARTGQSLLLDKFSGGAYSSIAGGSGTTVSSQTMPSRIKVQMNGTNIKVWLEDELQINVTDSSFATGTHIGFFGFGAVTSEIRLLSIRTTDTVTMNGLNPGQVVYMRADGKVPAGSAIANGSGVATFAYKHYPLETFEINGNDYTPVGGIWGGDTYHFNNV